MDSEIPYFLSFGHYASSAWCIMQHTMSLSDLLSFLWNPYIPFIINLRNFSFTCLLSFFLLLLAVTVIECNNNSLFFTIHLNRARGKVTAVTSSGH